MHSSYDIIIIGAGVIGLTQAAALINSGFTVAVVDAQAAPEQVLGETFDVRVFALNHFSQSCLKKWGVWQNIEYLRYASYHEVALSWKGKSEQSEARQAHQDVPLVFRDRDDAEANLGYIVEQAVWRQAALEKLTASTQCDFFWQHTLQCIEQTDEWLHCSVTQTHGPQQHTQQLQAKLLIGADGAHSQVRAVSGIKTESFPCAQSALIFNIRVAHPHQFCAAQYFCPQGIIAFLPLADPHCLSIVWSLPDDQLGCLDLSDDALACLLNHLTEQKWGEISIISKHFTFPLVQTQAAQYFAGKTVLIGDAAHTIHPLAGQGANLGIADIDALTACLMRAVATQRPIFDEAGLKKYARSRRSAAWQMIGLMSLFARCTDHDILLNPLLSMGSRVINRLSCVKNTLSRFALYQFTK